jgi:hypothetical protein
MTYQSGPFDSDTVQHTQKVYTIFWNPTGTSFPSGYQSTINQFVQDLNGSAHYAIASQYDDFGGSISGVVLYGGTWVDTVNAIPSPLGNQDVLGEVNRAKAANGWTSDNNSYFQVYTPSSVKSSDFCGYHNYDFNLFSSNLAYGLILYPVSGCFQSPPWPNGQVVDAAISVSAHEIMETVTDPFEDGWFYVDGNGEIGDLCNFIAGPRDRNLGSDVVLNGHAYIIQEEWSNASSGCVMSYGAPPVVTGVLPNPVSGSASSQTITINGTNFINKPWITVTWSSGAKVLASSEVTFLSSTQLQMTIITSSAADNWTVKVTNPNGNGSNTWPFTVVGPSTSAPTVTTGSASSITQTSATVNATVNPNGASTTLYFDYGPTTSYGSTGTYGSVGSGTAAQTQSFNLTNLTCGTTYQYKARAQNSAGTSSGANQSFATSACAQPGTAELLTNGSFASGSSGWVLSGNFFADSRFSVCHSCPGYAYFANADGSAGNNLTGSLYQTVTIPPNATSAAVSFWWYITTSETAIAVFDRMNVTIQNSSGGVLATIASLSNLSRTNEWVQNSADLMAYRGQTIRLNFSATTDASLPTVFRVDDASILVAATVAAPTVVTGSASSIGQTSATLSGTVNPNGANTTLYFDYGPSTSYGGLVTYGTVGSGTTNVSQSASINGLSCGTTYQWRARAENSGGTGSGSNQVFTTSACPPAPAIGLSTTALTFSEQQGGGSPLGQALTISNIGGGALNWSVSSDVGWLVTSSTNGMAPSTISVFVNNGLAAGTYQGTLTVTASDASNSPRTIAVTLVVTPPSPTICTSFSISPSSVSPGSAADSQSVTITGAPPGCQGGSWSASGNGSWLTVSPLNGSGSGSATVSWSQNQLTASRSDHATIAGNTFSVTQSASGSGGGGPHAFIDVPAAAVQVHDLGVGPDGSVYVLFPTFNPTALSVVKSTDGGTSWGSPVSIPSSVFSNYEYHLAVDSSGTIHVVWWLSSAGGTETYYSRSSNGGASFSSPIQVRTGNSYNGYRTNNATEPVVAADGAGNVYVAYGAYTKDGAGNFVGYNIWVSQSTNGGVSFQPEFSINTISSAQKFPRRIRATASNFYVLYMDETNNDLYFYRRNVGAASGNTGRLNASTGSVQFDGDFVGASNEMTFYAAYSDITGDSEGNITSCKSTDGGITWPVCTRVNDSANRQQDSPRVGLDSAGNVHMAWADGRSNGRYQIYYAYSLDGGATFSSNVNLSLPVTQTDFTQPHVVIDNPNAALYVSATRNYSQVVVARLSTTPTVPPPPTPTGVTAGAITNTRVDVSWSTVAGATYQIDRQVAGSGFSQIGTSATNSYSDTTASADSAYLYRVRAVNAGGASPSSAADLATTVIFIDNPLTAGTLVKAVHLSQLRTAVNTVRLLAGLGSGSYTGSATPGTVIGAIHITELRSFLDAARGALGLSTGGYSDASLTGVAVKAVHSQELRDRVK